MLQRTDDTHLEKEETPSQNGEGVFQVSTTELLLKEKMKILGVLVQTNEIIPFETFIFNSNNFCLYFKDGLVSDAFKNTPFFKTFKEENSILYNDIYSLLGSLDEEQKRYLNIIKANEENIKKLKEDAYLFHFFTLFYKAYLKLKKLGATNGDLLGFNS